MEKIQTILKAISDRTRQEIQQLRVRELDEEMKGVYVSYVDEGEETYDVRIEVVRAVVKAHQCDCMNSALFCNHQLAVLDNLATGEGKKWASPKKGQVLRLTETQRLLMDLDKEAVSNWLLKLFKAKKDLELQFLLEFATKETVYTVEEVRNMLAEVYQSTVGKRKKLSAQEVKKVADLVSASLQDVQQFVSIHSHDAVVIDLAQAVFDSIQDFERSRAYNSIRMKRVQDAYLDFTATAISQLKDEEVWKLLCSKIWEGAVVVQKKQLQLSAFNLIRFVYERADVGQKQFVMRLLDETLHGHTRLWEASEVEIKDFFLDVLLDQNRLREYASFFKPVFYADSFNLKLLRGLLEFNPDLVLTYAMDCMERNVKIVHNVPYNQLMHDAYLILGDLESVVLYKKFLLFEDFQWEAYHYIQQHDTQLGFTTFRKRLLSHLEDGFHTRKNTEVLYLEILHRAKDYRGMLQAIGYQLNLPYFKPYLEELFACDAELLLKNILRIGTYAYYKVVVDLEIVAFVCTHYDKAVLKKQLEYVICGPGSFNEAVRNSL